MILDKNYWKNRYQTGEIAWDAGAITTPIKAYIDHLVATNVDKNLKILIPGAGSGHEAASLWTQGFQNVFVCDWAEEAISRYRNNVPEFPESQLIIGDFFQLNEQFDLVIEQTFFCALDPQMRPQYAEKMADLLNTSPKKQNVSASGAWQEGVLTGVLFSRMFAFQGPPFGGDRAEYTNYFEPYFDILTMEDCHNSILPRTETELWIKLRKK